MGLLASFMIRKKGASISQKASHFVLAFFIPPQNSKASFWFFSEIKKPRKAAFCEIGGETGIRTQDALLAHTHFPGVLLRPLGHLSV